MAEYFYKFNYSLANEDAAIECTFVKEKHTHIFAICGSGSRVLPLLSEKIQHLDLVDISQFQLDYFKFKLGLIKALTLQEYRTVMGYTPSSVAHKIAIVQKANLDADSQKFFAQFNSQQLQKGLIYLGRWENYLIKLGALFRFILQVNFEPLFAAPNMDAQTRIFKKMWPQHRMKYLLKVLAHPLWFNLFLYKGRFADQAQIPLADYLLQQFAWFFTHQRAAKSFFMQMLFLGELRYEEGFPLDAQEEYFYKIKKFSGTISYLNKDLNSAIVDSTASFFSLSDVVSYYGPSQIDELSHLMLQKIEKCTAEFVIRSFMKHPQFLQPLDRFQMRQLESDAALSDSTAIYRFHIYSSL